MLEPEWGGLEHMIWGHPRVCHLTRADAPVGVPEVAPVGSREEGCVQDGFKEPSQRPVSTAAVTDRFSRKSE